MKKRFFLFTLILTLLLPYSELHGQDEEREINAVTLGYGYYNLYIRAFKKTIEERSSPYGEAYFTSTFNSYGPFLLKYDHALKSWFSLGASANYFDMKWEENYHYRGYINDPNLGYTYYSYTDVTRARLSSISVGLRANFHIGKWKRIDPYAGFGIGFTYNKYVHSVTSDNPNGYVESAIDHNYELFPALLYYNTTIGSRFYITKKIGLYLEIGIDKLTLAQAGLAVRF